ncbi:unnamed protein product [Effrenium voratum]|uniref:Thioredoxin domain-containing protein n=1 Tax=Effrenium voratum TaxID=2562239 RepID=A0AA36MZF4_9DINO|nr:unnamed protein product [Effrenium voratum]
MAAMAFRVRARSFASAELQMITDQKLKELSKDAAPLLLHCGAAWSQRSQRVGSALAEWAAGSKLLCHQLDVDTAPETIRTRHIKGVPTLLLLRQGRVEARADAADLQDLERMLAAAKPYLNPQEAEPKEALPAAEYLLESNGAAASALFRRALEDPRGDNAFRARLGLVRCALKDLVATTPGLAPSAEAQPENVPESVPPEPKVDELVNALEDLERHHEEELPVTEVRPDAKHVYILLAHAELVADAWAVDEAKNMSEEERRILRLWARGYREAAVQEALKWYQTVAGNDMEGLMAAYAQTERRAVDRRGDVPSRSIFSTPVLAPDFEGPVEPRALLRRLLTAALDEKFFKGEPSLVSQALADLAFLLDRKEFVRFYTRLIRSRRGGAPTTGRGTGKRSGFSKRYWICWPNTFYPNTKKMGSPHCDKND